ncbi:FRG domain-containing protein [Chitinophaga sp. SYP-B3965]|uniref:FRG domain-containing protein n=1 Tax=Chitinophaga sp. SYP-B3965 TaxID=2663120 RepID=UPI001299A76C|nr:FRG domain-containing protein [Chitinophaga sp. SYP-B3965]MRG45355.1 FRG domain-containing protein [Chitinophaga sp. SYP-B3965]
MQPIEGKLFSPFQKKIRKITWKEEFNYTYENETVWESFDATVNKIRASDGYPVTTFRQLVEEIANVTLSNKNHEMYYRGQTKDYKNNQIAFYKDRIPKSIIYPSICRQERHKDGKLKHSIKKSQIDTRYEQLSQMIELIGGHKNYLNEYYYSLFQHYDILPTPLIDITQSLRVAATFALKDSLKGYVYVLGLPYPNQSISYFSDLGIVLIKLQNVVPVGALRPRYQEGYLVGKYPIRPSKTNEDDLANRMVAKFLVDNSDGKFWDKYFQPMPEEILYPKNDKIEAQLLKIKAKYLKRL